MEQVGKFIFHGSKNVNATLFKLGERDAQKVGPYEVMFNDGHSTVFYSPEQFASMAEWMASIAPSLLAAAEYPENPEQYFRKMRVQKFVTDVLPNTGDPVNVVVVDNDTTEPDFTAFEVIITNAYNGNKSHIILGTSDDSDIKILLGEDFVYCSHILFLRTLFFDNFLTCEER